MYALKIALFVSIAALLIQINEASLPVFVIAQYEPKRWATIVKIAGTSHNESVQIKDYRYAIESLVDVAQDSVNNNVDNLNNLVKQAKLDAAASGKDISSCVKQEQVDLRKINLRALNQCRTPWTIRFLLLALDNERVKLAINWKWCIVTHPLSGNRLKQCFEAEIARVDAALSSISKDITSKLDNIFVNSMSCVEKNLGGLDLQIGDVGVKFNQCISNKSVSV